MMPFLVCPRRTAATLAVSDPAFNRIELLEALVDFHFARILNADPSRLHVQHLDAMRSRS